MIEEKEKAKNRKYQVEFAQTIEGEEFFLLIDSSREYALIYTLVRVNMNLDPPKLRTYSDLFLAPEQAIPTHKELWETLMNKEKEKKKILNEAKARANRKNLSDKIDPKSTTE